MRRLFTLKTLIVMLLVLVLNSTLAYGYDLGGDHAGNYQAGAYWPTNSNSHRQSPYDSFDKSPALKFKFTTGDYYGSGNVYYGPVIASDGTIYICTYDNKMYAINPDGSQKWVFGITSPYSNPVIGADGTIYVLSSYYDVVAINPNGTEKWTFNIFDYNGSGGPLAGYYGISMQGSLAIGTAGEIYAVATDTVTRVGGSRDKAYVLVAINPTGTYKWHKSDFIEESQYTSDPVLQSSNVTNTAAPSVASDGTVYVCLGDKLLGIKNGAIIKNNTPNMGFGHFSSSPVLLDGNIFVNLEGVQYYSFTSSSWVAPPLLGNLLMFREDTSLNYPSFVWENGGFSTPDQRADYPKGQFAVGADKTLYINAGMNYLEKVNGLNTTKSTASYLCALNPVDGTIKWKFPVSAPLTGAPIVTADGTIYTLSGHSGTVYAVNSDGTGKWTLQNDRFNSSMAIGKDGMIYITGRDGLYAYMEQYSVSFNTYGGNSVSIQNIFSGEYASEPTPTKTGHTFEGWYTDSTFSTPFNFSATPIIEDMAIHAKWIANSYNYRYTTDANGSLTGNANQTVVYGSSGTQVTAVPAEGYHFVSWSDGLAMASRTDSNVANDINVTANFAINHYTVDYIAGSNGSITGSISQTINHGSSGTQVTAVPNIGYHFVDWSDELTDISRIDTNITANKSFTANFAINQYSLAYSAGENGTLTGNTSQTVNHGSSGTLVTAVPNPGYHFVSWSDSSNEANRTDINVTGNIDVTANFAINQYALDYIAGGNGSITGSTRQTINHGSSGTLVTAVPNPGYHFESWSDGLADISRTDSNITANKSFTANFSINQYSIVYSAGENGTLTGNTSQIVDHGSSGTQVIATPKEGYHFVSWSDSSNEANRTDINVTGNINVTANFVINQYTLDYIAGANGSITGSTSQAISHGSNGTQVTAVPILGYHFVDWSDGLTDISRIDTNITANKSFTANFSINQYSLAYSAGENGTLTGSTSQTVNHGLSGTEVTAVPNTDYHFVNWSDGLTDISRIDSNITANKSFTANFAINQYAIEYIAGANGSITGSTSQIVNHGSHGTEVTAVPDEGYYFSGWSDGISTATRMDLNVTEHINETATFAVIAPSIQSTWGNGSVTITWDPVPNGEYYKIYQSTESENYWDDPYVRTESAITITGLTNGTKYYFVVRTVIDSEDSVDSNEISQIPRTIPQPPTHVLASPESGGATITFLPSEDNGGSEILGYTVTSVRTDGAIGIRTGAAIEVRTDGAITVTGLSNGTSYTFTVKAFNEVGESVESEASNSVVSYSSSNPFIQSALEGNGEVQLQWTEVPGATGYKIYPRTEYRTYSAITTDMNQYTVDGLTNGTEYCFVVSAINPGGESDYSNEVRAVPRTVPSIPTDAHATAGNRQATVTFTPPVDSGGSIITKYIVTTYPGELTVEVTGTSITVMELINGTTYTFTVKAVNEAGCSEASEASNSVIPKSNRDDDDVKIDTLITTDKVNTTITTTIISNTDPNGKASASVTDQQIADAVTKALKGVNEQGSGTASVKIQVKADDDTEIVETIISRIAMKSMVDSGIHTMISTPVANLTFDQDTLKGIVDEAADDIRITTEKVDTTTLSEELQQVVGNRPVYDFSITSGDNTISQFNGNVTVAVPYTPQPGEDPNAIVIYYINAAGEAERVTDCVYNPETGMVTFSTNHFSQYAVGYNKVTFKDVAEGAWYHDSVTFIAARGITSGKGDGNYGPMDKLTRGQFLVMVMRAYDIKPGENIKDNFSDAGSTYYTDYLGVAKMKGITKGIGNNLFAPEKEITRQEMFTLLYNVLKEMDKLPQSSAGKELADFSDTDHIADWATDAMTTFIQSGTISGSNGRLNPIDTTNRAEMAQVLYNLLSD